MTVDDVFEALEGRKVILHRGNVFFNTREHSETLIWEQKGARVVPWYTLDEMQAIKRRRERLALEMPSAGWEVHVVPMLDPVWEPDEEGEVNMAPERLRELCRTNW